ncbi:hypothetical protein KDN32_14965 [Nocardioides sp. J2M5]|uniref:hypothetical protein n=1 Tax=Nocardioides palaemonis TaxID=2829810 RepID=UPI001BA78EAE|nr:hypothetical protein [Nocardioides palaemonis]MBS2939039.1 hypothetical protein [Nocardioides palaemonis]
MPPAADRTSTADHVWLVEEREYARHEARRGRRHAYERLDPGRTALVVVDLVPFFVRESAYVRGIVPRVNALAAATLLVEEVAPLAGRGGTKSRHETRPPCWSRRSRSDRHETRPPRVAGLSTDPRPTVAECRCPPIQSNT